MIVGDEILYKRKKKIHEWEINKISPSGLYVEIENDDWSARWIHISDILEIIRSDSGSLLIYPEGGETAPAPRAPSSTANFGKSHLEI